MPRLKLLEMDIDNKMLYFRKDDKLIAFDADVAIELISDSLDGKYVPVRHGHWVKSEDADDGYCSVCKCDMPMYREDWGWKYRDTPYCPNCGAKMQEVE